jgi:type I restriction enzyme S subunit
VDSWTPERNNPDGSFIYVDLSAVDQEAKAITGARQLACANAPSRARQLLRAGDVLVSTVRPNLNAVARVPQEFAGATASTGFCVVRPQPEKLHGGYLFHWVRSPRFVGEMVRRATGASYPAVSDRIVLDSRLPLPPLLEQRRIAEILDKAEALRAKRRDALAKLDTLTQSIFLDMFGDPATNPKGWPESLLLGDVADIVSGVTIGRSLDGKGTRTVPYLAVVNVQDRRLDMSVAKTTRATDDEIRRYRLERNDLLLTEGGDPDKLGRGTLWNEELPECIHQNHVFRVRLQSEELTPLFLNWLVGSQRGKRYFLRAAKQTTGIASINMTQLRAFPLLVPPLALQLKFAETVAKIEGLRKRETASLGQIDGLFASLQDRAFRGEL